MPTVSTVEQFLTALQSAVDGSIIELANDIDFNNWIPPANQTYPIHVPSDATQLGDLTINGNGHTIYNLANFRPSAGSSLFYLHTLITGVDHIKFNNINFLNVACTNDDIPLFSSNFNSGASAETHPISFNDCTIQGVFNSPFGNSVYFARCMMTLQSSRNAIESQFNNRKPYYYMCWIWLKDVIKWNNNPFLTHLDTCYVQGQKTQQAANTNNTFFTNCINSCINFTANITQSTPALSTVVQAAAGTTKINIVNTDHLTGTAASTSTAIVGVTDEQMKNAQYLFDIGFDILPT